MGDLLISATVLMAAVLLIRFALGKRLPAGMRYALWLAVLVRLLIPVQLFHSPVSVLNAVPQRAAPQVVQRLTAWEPAADPPRPDLIAELPPDPVPQTPTNGRTAGDSLLALYVTGAAAVGLFFLLSNAGFALRLFRARRRVGEAEGVRVYRADFLRSPCLAGLFRPAVYLPSGVGEERMPHVLAHELSHRRHGDNWWALLRCAALCLWWFHPLAWVSAVLSRRDCELCCDAAALRRLGEAERIPYGETLVALAAGRGAGELLMASTAMTAGKKELAERVRQIARRPKIAWGVLGLAVLLAAAVLVFTYSGRVEAPEVRTGENGIELRYPGKREWTALDPLLPQPEDWKTDSTGGRDKTANLGEVEGGACRFAGFTSPREGWAVAVVGKGVAHEDTYVYLTHDGGRTWTETGHPDPARKPNAAWIPNCAAFSDELRGVICIGVFSDSPIWLTCDGGDSWTELDVPLPKAEGQYYEGMSVSFDGKEGRMEVRLRTHGQEPSEARQVLVSHDWGETWTAESSAPAAPDMAERKENYVTCLLLGKSDVGTTDVVIAASYDADTGTLSLMSIPSRLYVDSNVPYLSAWSIRSPEELQREVERLLGIPIDSYAEVDRAGMAAIIDAMGGVDYDVKRDMDYDDSTQNLSIHLEKGVQHLTGEQAVMVAQFRNGNNATGYADGDLGRIQAQQELMTALAEKAASLESVEANARLAKAAVEHLRATTLKLQELLWLITDVRQGDQFSVRSVLLPGSGGSAWSEALRTNLSVYVADPEAALDVVNEMLNPYVEARTLEDMNFSLPPAGPANGRASGS